MLFDSEDWIIEIFKKLQLNKKPENYSIGQGLNLSKDHIVDEEIIKNFNLRKKYLYLSLQRDILFN